MIASNLRVGLKNYDHTAAVYGSFLPAKMMLPCMHTSEDSHQITL